MDFKNELAQYGYNLGNAVDVEILIDEILPKMFSQKQSYSEKDLKEAFKVNYSISFFNTGDLDKDFKNWLEKFNKKKQQWNIAISKREK